MGNLNFFIFFPITIATAKDDTVCPDGKEKLLGALTNRFIPSIAVKGRPLCTKFLSTTSPINELSTNEAIHSIPTFLYFLLINNNKDIAIQINPKFPIDVINIIILFKKSFAIFL